MTNSKGETTSYAYDSQYRFTTITDSLGYTQGFTYDTLGNLTSQTDQEGRITYYLVDALGRRVGELTPDADGDLSTTDDRYYKVNVYDLQNLVTSTGELGGTPLVSAQYDAFGQQSSKSVIGARSKKAQNDARCCCGCKARAAASNVTQRPSSFSFEAKEPEWNCCRGPEYCPHLPGDSFCCISVLQPLPRVQVKSVSSSRSQKRFKFGRNGRSPTKLRTRRFVQNGKRTAFVATPPDSFEPRECIQCHVVGCVKS